MKIVFDGKKGLVVPNDLVIEKAEEILSKNEDITICSTLLFIAICLVMAKKGIDINSVVFNGKEYFLDDTYQIRKSPKGFADQFYNIIAEYVDVSSSYLPIIHCDKIN